MNTLDYNVSGEKRKKLVRAMSEILGEDAVYQGAPSFAYRVDGYMVSRNGLVAREMHLSRATVQRALNDLYAAGYLSKENRWRENGGCTSNLYKICDSS